MENYYNADNRIIAAMKTVLDNAFQTLKSLEAQSILMTGHKPHYYINGYQSNKKEVIRCINEQIPFITEFKHSKKFNIILKYQN